MAAPENRQGDLANTQSAPSPFRRALPFAHGDPVFAMQITARRASDGLNAPEQSSPGGAAVEGSQREEQDTLVARLQTPLHLSIVRDEALVRVS